MLITIAIPCYRSEKYLEAVVREIIEEFKNHPEHTYQIVLVCDGSPDHTDEVIRKLCNEDKNITGVILSKNFSQENARMAALPYVNGDVMVYMDDDGQHPPADIFKLVDKINEGYDIVYAKFESRKHSGFRCWTSNLYGAMAAKVNDRPKGITISAFYAYSRFAVDQLKKHRNPIPSSGAFLYSVTRKVTNIDSYERKRIAGTSGYNLIYLIKLCYYSLTNYTIVPLRMIGTIGYIFAGIGFIGGLIIIIRRLLLQITVPGYTSNIVLLLFVGGLILSALGLVGEYIGRIYMLLSNRPQYIVREEINSVPTEE